MSDPARDDTAGPAALERVGREAVERARRAGAAHAEAVLGASRSFSVRVTGGAIESVKQSATRGLGLRVLVDGAEGFVTSTDLTPGSLEDLARHAVALARFSTPDEANAFPTPAEAAGEPAGDLGLVDPAVPALAPERAIEMALELERVALGPRDRYPCRIDHLRGGRTARSSGPRKSGRR